MSVLDLGEMEYLDQVDFPKIGARPITELSLNELKLELDNRSLGIKISEDENSLAKSLDPVQTDHLRAHLSDSFQVVFLDLEFKHHTILEVGIVLVDLVTWKMKEFHAILRQTKEFMKSYVGRSSIPRTKLEADSSPRVLGMWPDDIRTSVVIDGEAVAGLRSLSTDSNGREDEDRSE
ncbi:hypothetical protein ISN44_As13g007320 [Arabidopsis suecica]|uniref:Uncharacterized protein n=1 Tax=Arabidopsis suecica TaxID=45249 RepID=A0A8T1XR82_ARASU|nr:hypothetical protein ISN44_As13g007320 [Arabidopsis suecica]